MYLALKDLHGPRRGDDPNWVDKCQNGKIGRFGRPARVGNLGNLVAPRLDSQPLIEAGSDPRGHLWVTWGVCLWAGKPPLADIILSHPPDLT